MKIQIRILISVFTLFIFLSKTNAQMVITDNDTIPVFKKSVHLNLVENNGAIQWESSENGLEWQELPNENTDSLIVDVASSNYYRAKVTTDYCAPYYSDTTLIKAGELIAKKNDVYSNEIVFIETDFIDFQDTVLTGIINNDTVKLLVLNNSLAFTMPEKIAGDYALNNPPSEKVGLQEPL